MVTDWHRYFQLINSRRTVPIDFYGQPAYPTHEPLHPLDGHDLRSPFGLRVEPLPAEMLDAGNFVSPLTIDPDHLARWWRDRCDTFADGGGI